MAPAWGGGAFVFKYSRAGVRRTQRPRTRSVFEWRIIHSRSPPIVDASAASRPRSGDPPVTVRLAADDHDVDLIRRPHPDELVRRGAELAGERFLAEGGARIQVVLHELVVPVLTRRHAPVLADPIDQGAPGLQAADVL